MNHQNFLHVQDIDQTHTKTHASGPIIQIKALNSPIVLNETTEEGRLFLIEIVPGKSEFFRSSLYRQIV